MIIIFGATGDLAKRKLIPAIYQLVSKEVIDCPVVCVSREKLTKEEYLKKVLLKKHVRGMDNKTLRKLKDKIYYFQQDLTEKKAPELAGFIKKIDKLHKCDGNKVFYLATPPLIFKHVTVLIKNNQLLNGRGYKRVVFEKPFGYDLASAEELNQFVTSIFKEEEIYRIDHFLGKELVQNMVVLRFANPIFEQIWNKEFIDNVQIIIDEKEGVGLRGDYYDKAGAVRDMVQNHVLQVLSLIAMEHPETVKPEDLIKEKVKVLKKLNPVKPGNVVLGQYKGYRDEARVKKESNTETFAALKITIDNDRWRGVPFYVRTGKCLSRNNQEVNVVLKDHACRLFCKNLDYKGPNVISVRVKPNEGISIQFNAKKPGHGLNIEPVVMDYCHVCRYPTNSPEAYELMLHEVLMGNKTLFTDWQEVENSWKFINPVLKIKDKKSLEHYKKGTKCPEGAEELLKRDGREWIEVT
ncbi:glucose-6-phosphate dehydrogenase [archaeon]|nr:glucose-6-phosphate dehydrogenase [archaeon]